MEFNRRRIIRVIGIYPAAVDCDNLIEGDEPEIIEEGNEPALAE
jgi:hypothetical protein